MNLDEFLYNLHFDTDKARPLDFEVEWDDAPLPFKLYRGLPVIPFSPDTPLTLFKKETPVKPTLHVIGHFLWYVYGLTQFSHSAPDTDFAEPAFGPMQLYRRFIPSGGSLYPNELYVYLKLEDAPTGIYHYDVVHHRLVLLRSGNFDSYIAQALGERCDIFACFATVFVSTMFWKNFFKYNNFSYRLQGQDAGVLIGQLLEVAKRFGFESGVYFQFLDRAINHLLGLSEREESVYAVIPLAIESGITWFGKGSGGDRIVSAAELCRELPAIQHDHYVRSQRVLEYPTLLKMNEVSLQDSPRSFRQIEGKKKFTYADHSVTLPNVKRMSYDLASVCRKRFSPGMNFFLDKVSQKQLATLLQEVTASFVYRNDLDEEQENPQSRVALYCCLYNVEGIPDGAYRYDSANHALRLVRLGDHRHWLQKGMYMETVNLFQTPLCFHVSGAKDHLIPALGYRGYRIQQMESGMLVQRLLLAASAIGMQGHALLGYDSNISDEIYQMAPIGETSLIQIPVGSHHASPKLEGSLRS
ncbi:SagB/ThcOx family dehydrogenase [Brevibacillus fluminis]|uniref:SagB/ThcOx family dehydrogenase n=1 Tax=Brevibacillus fluminis TaxID=511487 RepID=A0A3M8DRL7_9BACL|nr:SagB family peptide dehydrogenase [Brevibacillus fluminis]RNB90702.1 SagB/ThcOx family dehydrogenase [Brevibacillus fluminis]